jgi:hypothetical protein
VKLLCLLLNNIDIKNCMMVSDGSESPDPCWIHHCTVYILNFVIHYKIAIPYYTNSLGYIRSQQLVNNIQSMVRKKRKETVFGCVKCSKHYFSYICQRPSCSSWYQYCWIQFLFFFFSPCFGYCLQVVGFLYSLENWCNMELLFYNG